MDLADRGKGSGKDIAAEGKAEFERGSDKIGLAPKPTTAPSTHTGAASDPHATTGVSTIDPSDTRQDADPGRRTEKEAVPTTVDDSRSAIPDEKRSTPRTSAPGPPPVEGAQYDTKEGQKTGPTLSSQEKKSDDTANDPSPTSVGKQRDHSDTAIVPE